jgi:hypothetical protein
MAKLYPYLFLVLFLSSCRSEDNTKFFWVNFRPIEGYRTDTTEIKQFKLYQNGDTAKVSYYLQQDTIHYTVLKNKRDTSFVRGFYGYNGPLQLRKDTTVVIGKERFNVTAYIIHPGEEYGDETTIHYYSPKVGVFAIHSIVMPRIWCLQTNDTTTNRTINKLIKFGVDKFWIRGTLAKVVAD